MIHKSTIMETAKYIFLILRSNQMVMWSWGFSNPIPLTNNEGLIFSVDGYKHKGFVKVIYDEGKDLFIVILLDILNNELLRIDNVYFDSLVDVIDEAVERTSDYEVRVMSGYCPN